MSTLDDDNLWHDSLLRKEDKVLEGMRPGIVDRLVHFLVDMTVVTVAYYVMVMLCLFFVLPANTHTTMVIETDPRLVVISAYVLYTFLFALVTGGKTLGNYVTGFRCVTTAGSPPGAGRLLLRSLCRLIPLDPLSLLLRKDAKMWHDALSKTELRKPAKGPHRVSTI